ncbi:purine-nucleoside phosphorylase [Candidatus Enterococcus murrayae]|uniref:Purine nucleoside phosphorylase n=1 Tax=Candidatus Enterococcus murrayae TaxID=2815321 RepID=A0ABS3HGP4_9ENTE|nr:purine-nucleoside phosphorylase [Enterococcus sp. MJM16]MBO0452626.1 purine-nucleoside phosphorylase [Enterococcus sp. MJM16]
MEKLLETAGFLKERGVEEIDFGLVLGSGLGELAEEIEEAIIIPYQEIPHFPIATVVGHTGQLIYGKLSGRSVLAMQGRFHYYEGYQMERIVYPIRVMKVLGCHSLIVTNAAGGINKDYQPGDLMLITDQVNCMGSNPLIGINIEELGPRFPDMSQAYDMEYQQKMKELAKKLGIPLKEGIYLAFSGPAYETPAEIQMARILGADAVGMSTVPEVIAAKHAGMKVLGISCITNLAAGLQQNLNHEEVVDTTQRVKTIFSHLIKKALMIL